MWNLRPQPVLACLLLGPLAGLAWSKGEMLPSIMVCSFSLSLLGMAGAGVLAQSLIDGVGVLPAVPVRRSQPGVFQLLWFGQLALFALALALTPFAALLADRTGWHVPLKLSLPLALFGLAYIAQRKRRLDAGLVRCLPGVSIVLAALVGLGLFRGVALHSFHAGALGHDTQQHLYWTEHIFDYGYLPFAARGTDLLEEYPRFLHLLTACWSALGFAPTTGPYLKLMPLLQLALTAGFTAELLLSPQAAAARSKSVTFAGVFVGGFLAWHLTRGSGRGIMPLANLSGLPRFSAAWALFGLPMLVLAHRVGTLRNGVPWLLAGIPVYGAIAAGINPALAVLYVAFTLPFSALLFAFTGMDMGSCARACGWRKPLLAGCVATALLLVANTFVVNALVAVPMVNRTLAWVGIRTSSAALDRGHWISEPKQAVFCDTDLVACVATRLRGSLQASIEQLFEELSFGTLPTIPESKYSIWYWLVFATPWVVIAFTILRRTQRPAIEKPALRLLGAIGAATALSSVSVVCFQFLLLSVASVGALWSLLAGYYALHPRWLGSSLQVMLALSSWLFMPVFVLRPRIAALSIASVALLLFVTLSSLHPRKLAKHPFNQKGARIDWRELRAISALNRFVPEHEAVLIPARYHTLNEREHILTANTPLGLIASHLDTGLLFAFSLGTGADYGWADLAETFCGPSAEARSMLLRHARVRWVLLRDKRASSRRHFDNFRWSCGIAMSDLQAEFPPAWRRGDLALYRISP